MPQVKLIEVLGPGCSRCQKAYSVVRRVVEEAGLDTEVRKDESVDRMVELGILATPAVVADGVVKMAGQVPTVDLVRLVLGIEDRS